MSNGLIFAFSVIAIILPFIISIIVALRGKEKPKNISDYFLFEQELSASDFLRTSVGYSLQVAAIFLFLYWSLKYGLISLIVPFFWFLGYRLLIIAVESGKLDEFLNYRNEKVETDDGMNDVKTIHGYIGEIVLNNRKILVYFMAISTILGLGGTIIAELDYVSAFIFLVFGFEGQGNEYFSHIIILAFTGFYVLWGGYKAVVATDRVQVPISYISFALVIFISTYLLAPHSKIEALIFAISTMSLFIFFWFKRRPVFKAENDTFSVLTENSIFGLIILIGLFTIFQISDITSTYTFHKAELFPAGENDAFWGFGVFGIISLAWANTIWQFVDISSLQRLLDIPVILTPHSGHIDPPLSLASGYGAL